MVTDSGVSVVIPAYNAAQTLAETLESALAQTYRAIEVLVIDDGSTDETAAIVERYAAQDGRVRLLRNAENAGVSCARNRGVRAAVYPWIAFLDSDDRWRPEKLERQLTAVQRHPACALCFTSTAYTDEAGRRLSYILQSPPRVTY